MTKSTTTGFRTWKSGKKWLFASAAATTLMLAGANVASADEVQTPAQQPQAVATVQAQPTAEVTTTTTATASSTQEAPAESAPVTQSQDTTAVAVDNSSVEAAAQNATEAGVEVTETAPQDYGVAQDQQDLENKQTEIAQDQQAQVDNLNAAAQQSKETNQAYTDAKDAVDSNNNVVDTAKQAHEDYVTVKTESVGQGNTTEDYKQIQTKAEETKAANEAKVTDLETALNAYLNSTDSKAEMSYTTQNVDNVTFGESSMDAKVDSETGAFTLTHDMNDGYNSTLGNLGTGTLDGTLLWHSTSNHDGSQSITIDGIKLGKYVYVNHRASQAVDNNAEFIVKDKDGKVIYNSGQYDVNNSFTDTIDQTSAVNQTIKLDGNGASSDVIQVLNVDDNWIYNTHGQVAVKFTTENNEPAKVELVKLSQPEKPAPVKAEYHGYTLAVENPKPAVPTPGKGSMTPAPEPAQPTYTQATLPETGDAEGAKLAMAGVMAVAAASAVTVLKRKEQD